MLQNNIRPVNELYKIIRELYISYINDKTIHRSEAICSTIANAETIGLINFKEKWVLLKHFGKEKPSQIRHGEFFYTTDFVGGTFWWNNFKKDETNATRLRFIDKMILLTKHEKS